MRLPVLSAVVEAGPEDRVFGWLLLLGPVLIGAIVLLGRGLVSELLALAYIGAVVGRLLYLATWGNH